MEETGLQHVRGCEVLELRDADGKLLSDSGARERGAAKGTQRTLLVALDTAQYQARAQLLFLPPTI